MLSKKLPLRKFPNIKPACLPVRRTKYRGPGFISERDGGVLIFLRNVIVLNELMTLKPC